MNENKIKRQWHVADYIMIFQWVCIVHSPVVKALLHDE